jgi:hypothetical protein
VGIEVACQRGGLQRNLRALRIHTEVLDVSTRSSQLCIRKKVVGGAILLKDNQGLNLLRRRIDDFMLFPSPQPLRLTGTPAKHTSKEHRRSRRVSSPNRVLLILDEYSG